MSALETTSTDTPDSTPEVSVEMSHSSAAVQEEREPVSDDTVNCSSGGESSSTSMVMQLSFEELREKTDNPSPVVENERNKEKEVHSAANSPEAAVISEIPRKVQEFVGISENAVWDDHTQDIEVNTLGTSANQEKVQAIAELFTVAVEDDMRKMESSSIEAPEIVSDSALPNISESKEPAITGYEHTLVNDTEDPLTTAYEEPSDTASEELLVYSTEKSFIGASEEGLVIAGEETLVKASDEPLATPENSQLKVCKEAFVTASKEPLFKVPEEPFSTVFKECIVNESEEPLVATSGEPLITISADPHPNACEEAIVNVSGEILETNSEENIVNMPEERTTNATEERRVNSSEELFVSASEEPDDNISEEPEIIDTTQVIPIDYAAEYNNYAAFKRALDKFNEEGHEFILGPSTKHTTKDFKYKRATFQCKYGPIEEEEGEDEEDDISGMKTILCCPALLRLQFDREERVLRIISYDPLHARHGLVRANEAANEADEIDGPTSPRAATDGRLPRSRADAVSSTQFSVLDPPPSPAVQMSPRPLVEGTFPHYLAFKKHHWEEVTRSRRNSRIGSTSPRKSSVCKKGTTSAMSPPLNTEERRLDNATSTAGALPASGGTLQSSTLLQKSKPTAASRNPGKRKATFVVGDSTDIVVPDDDVPWSDLQGSSKQTELHWMDDSPKAKRPSKPGGWNISKQKQRERIALEEENRVWPWYREESMIASDDPDFGFPDVNLEYSREPSSPSEDGELADGLQRSEVQSDELHTEVIAEPISDNDGHFEVTATVEADESVTELAGGSQTSELQSDELPTAAIAERRQSRESPVETTVPQAPETTTAPPDNLAQTSPKRGRGRPLKTASTAQVSSQPEQGKLIENDAKSSTHTRGRGRPPKIDSGSDGALATRGTEASSTTSSGKPAKVMGSVYHSVKKRCRSVQSTPLQGFTSSSANMDGIKAQNVIKTQRAPETNQKLRRSNSENVPMKRGRGRPRKSESDKQPIRNLRSSLTLRSPENANVEKVEKESPRTAETENQPSGTSKVKSILTSPPPKRGRGRPLGAKNKQPVERRTSSQLVTLSSSKEYRKSESDKQPIRNLRSSLTLENANVGKVGKESPGKAESKNQPTGTSKVKSALTSPPPKRGRGRPLGAKNKQHQFVTLSSSKEYLKLRNGKTRSLSTPRNSTKVNAARVAAKMTAGKSRKSYFDGSNKGRLSVKFPLTSPSIKRGRGVLPRRKKQTLKLAATSQAPNTRRGRPITTDSTQLNDGIRKQKCTKSGLRDPIATTSYAQQRGRGRPRKGESVPLTEGTTAESLKVSNGQEPPPLKRGRNNSSKRDSEQPTEGLRTKLPSPVNRRRVRPPTRSCTMTEENSSPVTRNTQVSLPLKRTRSMPPNETSNSLSGDSRSESCSKPSPSAKIGRCRPPTRSSTNFVLRRSRKTAPTLTVTLRKRRSTPSIASTGSTKKRKENKMICPRSSSKTRVMSLAFH